MIAKNEYIKHLLNTKFRVQQPIKLQVKYLIVKREGYIKHFLEGTKIK